MLEEDVFSMSIILNKKNLAKRVRSWIMVALNALVAQLDRAPGYEPGGQRFESSPVHSFYLSKR